MSEGNTGKSMPEKKFSTGAISATIWKNNGKSKKTGEPVEFRTIQIDRRYTDKEGNWQSTNSLRLNDQGFPSLAKSLLISCHKRTRFII